MFSKHLPKTFRRRHHKKSSRCLQEVLENKKLLHRTRLQEKFLQGFTIMQFLATREVNESLAKFILSLASFPLLVSFLTVPFLQIRERELLWETRQNFSILLKKSK